MLAVSLSRCMKVRIRKYSAHRFIPGVVFKTHVHSLFPWSGWSQTFAIQQPDMVALTRQCLVEDTLCQWYHKPLAQVSSASKSGNTDKINRLLLFIVAILSDPLLYFSCSIVRKPGGVQVLRSANRETPFLGWQLCTSALYIMFFPAHLCVLYYLCVCIIYA